MKLSKGFTILETFICTAIITILIVWFFPGILVGKDRAVKTLEAHGYSDIEITNRVWVLVKFRGCGSEDSVRFTAKATNPAGKPAEVYVCAGLLKGGTIRVK